MNSLLLKSEVLARICISHKAADKVGLPSFWFVLRQRNGEDRPYVYKVAADRSQKWVLQVEAGAWGLQLTVKK
jgi:hypothetical protein